MMDMIDMCLTCGDPRNEDGCPCLENDAIRRSALADAAATVSDMERQAKEPYATAYRKAKEKILAMIVQ